MKLFYKHNKVKVTKELLNSRKTIEVTLCLLKFLLAFDVKCS